MADTIPREVSDQERWVCENRIVGISVDYVQIGTDTSATYVALTPDTGKPVRWLDSTFRKVARIELSHASIVSPAYGVAEAVKARKEYEKKNARELADYRRLKAKFEGTPHD